MEISSRCQSTSCHSSSRKVSQKYRTNNILRDQFTFTQNRTQFLGLSFPHTQFFTDFDWEKAERFGFLEFLQNG